MRRISASGDVPGCLFLVIAVEESPRAILDVLSAGEAARLLDELERDPAALLGRIARLLDDVTGELRRETAGLAPCDVLPYTASGA